VKGFDCALFRYRLRLRAPLRLPTTTLHEREGLLLRITDQRGVSGWGEAAPLPGFSTESIETAAKELEEVCHLGWSRATEDRKWSPSVAFARFSATWSFTSAHLGESTALSMHPDHDPAIQVQALLSGDNNAIVARAEALREENGVCRTVKLKVGDLGAEAAARRVALVAKHLGPNWRLRLDANRAWGFDEAKDFWGRVQDCPIEYVEEPLRDWTRLAELHADCGFRYALDETLREARGVTGDILERVSALVDKPTMMPPEDLPGTEDGDIPTCVSASFESGVGIAALASVAFVLDPDQPAGLDTYAWLAEDVLEEPLPLAPGVVSIEALTAAARRVDVSKLERIV